MGLGLHSAIHIASMGMGAAEKTINVSGNNLANANTYGYKSERADFTSFLSYNYNYGSAVGQYNAGTNPTQIGMGVELQGVSTNFTQGAFKEGMRASDVAINGNGFLIVGTASGEVANLSNLYYTRNGALDVNGNYDLVTNNGLYVMGFGINDKYELQTGALTNLRIPIGELHIAEQTTKVSLSGVLDAIGDTATQGTVLQTSPMVDLSQQAPASNLISATQITKPDTALAGTTATGGNAGGAVESGSYYYRFTYVDAAGIESDYSAPLKVEVQAGQNSVTLDNLPTIPAGYDSMRIYRSDDPGDVNQSGEFYLVDEIAATGSYTDLKSSDEITNPDTELELGRLNGTYTYYVTYYDALGNESRPSPVSSSITTIDGGGQLELSNIPTIVGDNPEGWIGRKVYRSTAGSSSEYHLVGEIDNLDADATLVDRTSDADLLNNQAMSWSGRGDALITGSTRLVDVGVYDNGKFTQAFQEGTLTYDPNKGGYELKQATLEITAETTVAEYLNFLNESLGIQTGNDIPLDQGSLGQLINGGVQGATIYNGSIYILGNAGEANSLRIDSNDMKLVTNSGTKTVNLGWGQDANNKQDAVGVGTACDLQVFDSLGSAVSVRLTMVLESTSNTETVYRWYADSSGNQPVDGEAVAVGTGLLRFDQNGELIDATNKTISVLRTQIASESPLDFEFEMDLNSLVALATSSAGITQTYQDGAGAGTLYDYSIMADGTIVGEFSSGVQRTLGQIVLATFANQEGLYKAGESLFQVSSNSGNPKLHTPGTGDAGVIKGNTLELSNADIGEEIVNMILASAMYRANSKVMTTSNEMFDALLRII